MAFGNRTTHLPAAMVGQFTSLQTPRPVLRFSPSTHFSIPLRRRYCSATVDRCQLLVIAALSSLLTLMCDPLGLGNERRLRGQSHEVALDDEASLLLFEEQGGSLGVFIMGLIIRRHAGGEGR